MGTWTGCCIIRGGDGITGCINRKLELTELLVICDDAVLGSERGVSKRM